MEVDDALLLFRRSVEKLNLIYKTYVGDGDSKSYTTVSKAMRCDPLVYIEKEECIGHITKRMGAGFCQIVGSCRTMK